MFSSNECLSDGNFRGKGMPREDPSLHRFLIMGNGVVSSLPIQWFNVQNAGDVRKGWYSRSCLLGRDHTCRTTLQIRDWGHVLRFNL